MARSAQWSARDRDQAARPIAFCLRRWTDEPEPDRLAILGDRAARDVEAFGVQQLDELVVGEDLAAASASIRALSGS